MRTLGLIPARGGSKRLPGKNSRLLHGKPLIVWTIEAAMDSALDDVWVSTEDEDIAAICMPYCHVVDRPAELSADYATTEEVVAYHTEAMGVFFERVMVLQPTSPLRNACHINRALSFGTTVVSVDTATRQNNGAMYLMDIHDPWRFEIAYLMPKEVGIDIDTKADFELAELLLTKERA